MESITITQITPSELQALIESAVKKVLSSIHPEKQKGEWLSLMELCEYHPDKPTKETVYSWVHKNLIPYHKGAKRLRFLQSEIDAWLLNGRKKTISELKEDAHTSIKIRTGTK